MAHPLMHIMLAQIVVHEQGHGLELSECALPCPKCSLTAWSLIPYPASIDLTSLALHGQNGTATCGRDPPPRLHGLLVTRVGHTRGL